MAKKIVFPIRLTDAQVGWIRAQAGAKPVTTWAREYLLQSAPEGIKEDRGTPIKPKG